MSMETRQWLSENTLVGYTAKRGNAWHYREGDGNHFPGAVPMARVEALYDFEVVERPLYMPDTNPANDGAFVRVPDRKAMVHEKTGDVLGIFKSGFQGHAYTEWLLDNVATLLDADLAISSAVLLKAGAVAAVQVEMEDTVSNPQGVDFRPFLTAYTSYDGSFATTYRTGVTRVVCDNTLAAAADDANGAVVKYRHSSNSLHKVHEARQALDVISTVADDFNAEVERMCAQTVTDQQFADFLEMEVPDKDSKAGRTRAVERRELLTALYRNDARVAPYKGTAFGVYQTMNTYRLHESPVQQRTERVERNTLNFLRGKVEKDDAQSMKNLQLVLSK